MTFQSPGGIVLTGDDVREILTSAKWLLGGVGAVIATIIGFLVRLAYVFGGHVRELKEVSSDMLTIKAHADRVPVLETRLGTLEKMQEESVRRFRSDIDGLKEKIPRPPSMPQIEGGE